MPRKWVPAASKAPGRPEEWAHAEDEGMLEPAAYHEDEFLQPSEDAEPAASGATKKNKAKSLVRFSGVRSREAVRQKEQRRRERKVERHMTGQAPEQIGTTSFVEDSVEDLPLGIRIRAERMCNILAETLATLQSEAVEADVTVWQLTKDPAVMLSRKEHNIGRPLGSIFKWFGEVFEIDEVTPGIGARDDRWIRLRPDWHEFCPSADDDAEVDLLQGLPEPFLPTTPEEAPQAFRIELIRALEMHGGSAQLQTLGSEGRLADSRLYIRQTSLRNAIAAYPHNFSLEVLDESQSQISVTLLSTDIEDADPPQEVLPTTREFARGARKLEPSPAEGDAGDVDETGTSPTPASGARESELPDEETWAKLPQWCRDAIAKEALHADAASDGSDQVVARGPKGSSAMGQQPQASPRCPMPAGPVSAGRECLVGAGPFGSATAPRQPQTPPQRPRAKPSQARPSLAPSSSGRSLALAAPYLAPSLSAVAKPPPAGGGPDGPRPLAGPLPMRPGRGPSTPGFGAGGGSADTRIQPFSSFAPSSGSTGAVPGGGGDGRRPRSLGRQPRPLGRQPGTAPVRLAAQSSSGGARSPAGAGAGAGAEQASGIKRRLDQASVGSVAPRPSSAMLRGRLGYES